MTSSEEDGEVMKQFTAIIQQEGNGYVATCPEVGVVSQGDTVDEARSNLKEALELFFEFASDEEIQRRTRGVFHVMNIEVAVP